MKKSIRTMTRGDRVLLVLLLFGSLAGIFAAREAMPQASAVIVELEGKPLYTFPLGTDRTVAVNGPFGNAVVEISGRQARVRDASCQNRICIKTGWVSRGVIVCLPGRITVFVGGDGESRRKDIDAVTG